MAREVAAYFAEYEANLTRWLNDEIERKTRHLVDSVVREVKWRLAAEIKLHEANEQLALVRQQYQDANNRAMGLQLKLDARE